MPIEPLSHRDNQKLLLPSPIPGMVTGRELEDRSGRPLTLSFLIWCWIPGYIHLVGIKFMVCALLYMYIIIQLKFYKTASISKCPAREDNTSG